MISITINGVAYDVPSSAADTNWAAQQVAFEQALVAYVNTLAPSTIEGTPGSGPGLLNDSVNFGRHVVRQITLAYDAFSGSASTTEDVAIWTLPAKTRVLRVVADVTTPFTGGSISDIDVTVGRTAGGDEYLLSFDADTATGTYGIIQSQIGDNIVGASLFAPGGEGDMQWAESSVQCRFTATGANLDSLSAGSVTFYLETCTYP